MNFWIFCLGVIVGAVLDALVWSVFQVYKRRGERRTLPVNGYAVTYPTLDAASRAYQGQGVIVRLTKGGPAPITEKEINQAGAVFLGALHRARQARKGV